MLIAFIQTRLAEIGTKAPVHDNPTIHAAGIPSLPNLLFLIDTGEVKLLTNVVYSQQVQSASTRYITCYVRGLIFGKAQRTC